MGGISLPLAACGGEDDDTANADVLQGALELELSAAATYDSALAALRGEPRRLARSFAEQERLHAAVWERAIRKRGARPIASRTRRPPVPRSDADALRRLIELESEAIAAYVDAIPGLSAAGLRRTALTVLANQAEHLAALRDAAGRDSVPNSLVTAEVAK